jgi:transcriptional regulator with XRE-family HTH domain
MMLNTSRILLDKLNIYKSNCVISSMNEKLGSYLKQIRKSQKLSLRTVEAKTEISNAYLSQLENNTIKKPSPLVLHKLARCYNISYDYLMKLTGYPVSKSISEEEKASSAFRLGTFNDLTQREEEKLLEYLQFLRSRGKAKR